VTGLDRLFVGLSRRWRLDPTTSAMESLPDIGQKTHRTAASQFPLRQDTTRYGCGQKGKKRNDMGLPSPTNSYDSEARGESSAEERCGVEVDLAKLVAR
jgi:hypothetical protein